MTTAEQETIRELVRCLHYAIRDVHRTLHEGPTETCTYAECVEARAALAEGRKLTGEG